MVIIILFILGIVIGSFLNVVIDRAPSEESIVSGRSHCDACRKPLRWFELIPVLSFLLQRGHCLRCHAVLSWQYPTIELLTGFLFVWSYAYAPAALLSSSFGVTIAVLLLVASSFLVILVADMKYQLIPDTAVVGILLAAGLHILSSPHLWIPSVVSGAVGGGIFWFLWWITHGRGMGFGDVKLAGVLGLLLGYPLSLVSYYVAFLTGATVGVILILGGKAAMKTKIPFGPFLIFGAVVALAWGHKIIAWWGHYV